MSGTLTAARRSAANVLSLSPSVIWTNDRAHFHFLRHALCPLIAAAVMILPIYGSVWPWPEWPANLITVLAFVWILLGVLVGYRLRSRREEVLKRAEQILTSSSP